MPGVYIPGEMDLAGTIVGVVERDQIIDGTSIAADDILIGLSSSGLHTNGFSLVRSIFGPETYGLFEAELDCTLGEALVEPHKSYLPQIKAMLGQCEIKGLAHITGGGFVDNIPRVLPDGLGAIIDRSTWSVPPLFSLIESQGAVDHDEMYRVFNMGMGMIVIVDPNDADAALAAAGKGAALIGHVVTQNQDAKRVILL